MHIPTVMVVDDTAAYWTLLKRWCRHHGIPEANHLRRYRTTSDARIALTDGGVPWPDLLLLDNLFPVEHGVQRELGRELLDDLALLRTSDTVVVFLSSDITEELASDVRRRGADIVVPRQVLAESFETALEDAYQLLYQRRGRWRDEMREQVRTTERLLRAAARPILNERRRNRDALISPADHALLRACQRATLDHHVLLISPFPDVAPADADRTGNVPSCTMSSQALEAITDIVKRSVRREKFIPVVADRAMGGGLAHVFDNVARHMWTCGLGIAIFARRENDPTFFNPNVMLEIGFMSAMSKPLLLLNLTGETNFPADLNGIVRVDLPADVEESKLARIVADWLARSG